MRWYKFLFVKKPRRAVADEAEPGWTVQALPEQPPVEPKRKRLSRLPHFRGSARDQLQERGGGKFDRIRFQFRSVFTPSQPVMRRERFAGRAGPLARLIRGIEDQRLHAILYGDRGIGKTSLLHILADTAREAGYMVLYESCDADTQFDEMFRSLLGRIPQLYHGGVAPSGEDAGASLADMAPPGTLSARHAADLLTQVAGVRVIIMLDEFDRALSAPFRRSVAELIKNLSDRCARVQLVVAGVAANVTELVAHIPSIRRNILNLELPHMTDAEIDEMIAIGVEEGGLGFNAAARLRIRTIARGSPYVAALIAHHSGLAAIDVEAGEVSLAHVVTAMDAVLEAQGEGDVAERVPALVAGGGL